jgi:hypothetical protein
MNRYFQDFSFENGVLNVHLSGEFPNELLRKNINIFQTLIDECANHNCKKALIDARDLQVNFGTMDLFQTGEDAAILASIGLRIAFIARKDMLDPFFDNVSHNRGGQVGIFTDIDSARDWIQR